MQLHFATRLRVIALAACLTAPLSGCVLELALLPLKIGVPAIAAAIDDTSSTSYSTPDKPIGYCIYSDGTNVFTLYEDSASYHTCGPNAEPITKAEFDAFIKERSLAYCVDGDRLYRDQDCNKGDTSLTRADWEALDRYHATPAVL